MKLNGSRRDASQACGSLEGFDRPKRRQVSHSSSNAEKICAEREKFRVCQDLSQLIVVPMTSKNPMVHGTKRRAGHVRDGMSEVMVIVQKGDHSLGYYDFRTGAELGRTPLD